MNCAIDRLAAQVAGLELDLVAGISRVAFCFFYPACSTARHWIDDDQKARQTTWKLGPRSYDLEYGSAELTIQADAPVAGRSLAS